MTGEAVDWLCKALSMVQNPAELTWRRIYLQHLDGAHNTIKAAKAGYFGPRGRILDLDATVKVAPAREKGFTSTPAVSTEQEKEEGEKQGQGSRNSTNFSMEQHERTEISNPPAQYWN